MPVVATATRGRGASRNGAAAAAFEAFTVEVAAQRARQEADRFQLPAGLLARVLARERDSPERRKRKREDDGAFALHAVVLFH